MLVVLVYSDCENDGLFAATLVWYLFDAESVAVSDAASVDCYVCRDSDVSLSVLGTSQ